MVLNYDDNGLLQAMQNKWTVERANNPLAKIGGSIGSGIVSGYESGIKNAAEETKAMRDFTFKLFETNVPALVVDSTKPVGNPDRYKMIPTTEWPKVAEGILKKSNPASIELVPASIFAQSKTTPMEAQMVNEYTGETKPGFKYTGKVGDAPTVVKYGTKPVSEEDLAIKKSAQDEKTMQVFLKDLNLRRDNAMASLDKAQEALKNRTGDEREVVRAKAYIKNIDEANTFALRGDIESAKSKLQDFNVVVSEPASTETGWGFLTPNKEIPARFTAVSGRPTPAQPAQLAGQRIVVTDAKGNKFTIPNDPAQIAEAQKQGFTISR